MPDTLSGMDGIRPEKTPDPISVEAQSRFFRLKFRCEPRGGGGGRGSVSTFSRESRKRMLETLARLDLARAGFVCFVSLTYPDQDGPAAPDMTEAHRRAWLKRIKRRFPEASAIWRREWEPRKSGAFESAVFPHYHALFFGLPFVHHAEINRLWAEVLGFEGYLRTEIKGIRSAKQAFYYVSKYMAKVERPVDGAADAARELDGADGGARGAQDAPADADAPATMEDRASAGAARPADPDGASAPGRRGRDGAPRGSAGGRAGDPTRRPSAGTAAGGAGAEPPEPLPLPCSLVYVAYLAGEGGESRRTIGRSWGVFNRRKLPLGERVCFALPAGRWLRQARQEAAEVWPGVKNGMGGGFSLFVEDAEGWAERMAILCEKEIRVRYNPESGEWEPCE